MATIGPPIECRLTANRSSAVERSRPQQERRFALLLVSALTVLAVAVNGYHPYAEDGGLYLAGVKSLLHPGLYPHSTAFVLEPTRFSLFAPMVAGLVRLSHLSLPSVVLALHLATIWAMLFAAWMLASRCWSTRAARSGAVALLACWLTLPVAGTALVLMDPYLTARSISTSCMIFALVGALDYTEWSRTVVNSSRRIRGLCLWIASTVLAVAMHPLMAAYALGATLILAILRSSSSRLRWWMTPALLLVALTTAACLQYAAHPESADYRSIALTRTYWFPAQWSWYELAGLAAPLAILAIFARRESPQPPYVDNVGSHSTRRAVRQMAMAAGTTACLTAMLFARAASATHLVARLQPLRVFQIIYLVLVLSLGATLGESILRRVFWRWAAAILLLGGIMFAAARSAFPNSPQIEFPWVAPQNPWSRAFFWIREKTPEDAMFALDADYINAPGEDAQCFRVIAERSSLPDYSKDGGEASIDPELTAAWKAGQQAQRALNAPSTTDAMRIAALVPLGVSWTILDAHTATNLDCPYTNAVVKVCRLP